MSDRKTRALLAEALSFFNDHPRFALRRDPGRTSYELAGQIDAHLAKWNEPAHPAVDIARERWRMVDFLRVDDDERMVEREVDGYWVRGWIRIGPAAFGEVDPALSERYDKALADLPALTRAVFVAHRQDNLAYAAVAARLGLTERQVEEHVARALVLIGKALGRE